MPNELLRKEFKALKGEIQDNRVRMIATVCGAPDRIGDVIMPKAFSAKVLQAAVTDGWLDMGHEWEEGYGMLVGAQMAGNELHVEGQFYDTDDAQRLRKKVQERLDNGKKVSVSIGFMPDYSQTKWFDSGKDLLKWASESGYDESEFDAAGIRKLGMCRAIPTVSELLEATLCVAGMHRGARATEAKDLTAEEEISGALDALVAAMEREAGIAVLNGRMSGAQKERLSKALDVLIPAFHKSEPAPGPDAPTVVQIPPHLMVQAMRLRDGL